MKWRTFVLKKKNLTKKLAFRTVRGQVALQISLFQLLNKTFLSGVGAPFLKKRCFLLCWGWFFAEYRLTSNKIQWRSWSTSGLLTLSNSLSLSTKRVCQTIHPPQNHIDGTYTPTDQPSFVGHVDDSVAAWQAVPWCLLFDGMADRTSKIVNNLGQVLLP